MPSSSDTFNQLTRGLTAPHGNRLESNTMMTDGVASVARKQGACLRCKRLKRKCDQKQPQCTQCKKKHQECSLQVFRVNTVQDSSLLIKRPRRQRNRATDSSSEKSPDAALNYLEEIYESSELPPDPDCSLQEDGPSIASIHTRSPLLSESEASESSLTKSSHNSHRDRHGSPGSCIEVPDFIKQSVSILYPQYSIQAPLTSGLSRDIVESPARRLLWDYFVNRASRVFLCWDPNDAKLDKAYRDPYTDNLPVLAVHSRPMMLACLALSAFHSAGGGRSREDLSLITSLMLEAANELAASRWQGPQTFERLLGTVGAASLLYLLKPSMYADMLSLSRSAALCLASAPSCKATPPLYQVVMQIFRWSDICSQCSLKRYVSIPNEPTQLLLELKDNERASNLSPSYADWVVHPLYAFPEELIAPLRRVAWLVRLRQQGCVMMASDTTVDLPGPPTRVLQASHDACSTGDNVQISPQHFDELVDQAEEMLHLARQTIKRDKTKQQNPQSTSFPTAPDLRTDIQRLAIAMDSAIIILLLTRLRDSPWTTPQIRFHVRNVVTNLNAIDPESRFSNGIVFPLYVAGLEAVDENDRTVIIRCIKHLPGLWSQRESQLESCLKHVWSLRDANPGATWISWIDQATGFEDCIPG
uniref:Zn(2)-C6 fungal-type domain-containing protein n=1 Tax=Gibberella zeae TaxID=5518 RepID=A0A4E9DY73_GIBZA